MNIRDINKSIKEITKKTKLTERDHKKLASLISQRAAETSKATGLKISSISYEEAKAFRDSMKRLKKK